MKSTKQELLDALKDAQKELKAMREFSADPGREADKAAEDLAIADAAEDVQSGIFSDDVNEKYRNLVKAMEIMDARLKEVYGVEGELKDMAVVIAAKKAAQIRLEEQLQQRQAEIDAEIARDEAAAKSRRADLDAEYNRASAKLSVDRKREQEEYTYNLGRKRREAEDKQADELAATERAIAAKKEELAALTADAEAIEAMKAAVAGFDEKLAAEYQKGFDDGKKDAGKEYGYKSAMAEKDHGYEIKYRDGEIARLTEDGKVKDAKIAALESKLDAAYGQVRDLATKTVESSGGVKLIATGGGDSGNTGRK